MIGLIDYGAGNLGSVINALGRLNADVSFVRAPEEIAPSFGKFEKIIFPGDGHFANAMKKLTESGYTQAIKQWIQADKPFLGICIGLQLLFENSEEAPPENGSAVSGLSVIPGSVRLFPGKKVPQIGWNTTEATKESRLFKGLPNNSFFYYIHSYYAAPDDASCVAASADYYVKFCAAVERGALSAVQFHPEKSGTIGLKLLENWLEM
jgi:imidazole glycerol phosphate synthase glutamine amidotransferase subunit